MGACERDWREHEEFFSKKISVPREICAEKEFATYSVKYLDKTFFKFLGGFAAILAISFLLLALFSLL